VDFSDFTQAYLAKVGEWLDIWNNRKYRTAASCHNFIQFKVHKSLQNQDFQYVEDLDEYIIKQINKDESFALLGCYVAEVDSFRRFEPIHPTPHHRSSCPFEDCLNLDDGMGPKGCSETSVANYQYTLHNIPEAEHLVYTAAGTGSHR
jgi:hypothetical protein